MSFTHKKFDVKDKHAFYASLAAEVASLMDGVWFSDLANAAALLGTQMPEVNWVGFYLFTGERLQLGPFHGLPACIRIALGKGVCGTAAQERRTIVVDDVDKFPGHIVCDSASRSEIVVPLIIGGRLIGVLDVDSPIVSRFTEEDRHGLERIAQIVATKSNWPEKII